MDVGYSNYAWWGGWVGLWEEDEDGDWGVGKGQD